MHEPEIPWKVLLVDDEEDIREVLSESLMDMGYDVLLAENGKKALDIFNESQPSIVMTDIKMPVMNGIDLLRAIKHENPETEVIMITGHGDMDLAIESLKSAATDFITKPINVDIIEIALNKVKEKVLIRRKLQEYTENLEILVHEKMQLKDHLSNLGLMIGSISHGIKGLLTGLDGGIYLVDSGFGKEDFEKIKEGWDVVKIMVERIRKRILDILYYAKERDLNLEDIEVHTFANDVAELFEQQAQKHGIDFIRQFKTDGDEFQVDIDLVHSALVNILENAVDACLKNTAESRPKIIFSVCRDNNCILFDIIDNGIGMNRETRDKLFTLFFSTKASEGTGLGLFIAHKIIQQHGGDISVHSTPGKGTRISIRLPQKAAQKDKKDIVTPDSLSIPEHEMKT